MIKGVIESRTCLKPMVTENSLELLRLHQQYRAGHLWTGGGVGDQPHYYNQAMTAISGLLAEPD